MLGTNFKDLLNYRNIILPPTHIKSLY